MNRCKVSSCPSVLAPLSSPASRPRNHLIFAAEAEVRDGVDGEGNRWNREKLKKKREGEWRARSRLRGRVSRRVVNRRDKRWDEKGSTKRAGTVRPKGPHRTRHARALPGGPAHVSFGYPRAASVELVRSRLGPVVESHRGHTDRARANASWVAFACRPAGRT